MDVDLHIHSKYSFDSFLDVKTICKVASKRGLDLIAITDHNSIEGSLVAMRYASNFNYLKIIPGVEIKTNFGDLIGLFVNSEIKSRMFHEVVEEIKDQGGLVVLPHPYNHHYGSIKCLAKFVDIIEVFNGRVSNEKNRRAYCLAKMLDKPMIASSDSHFSFEIGCVRTRFDNVFFNSSDLKSSIIVNDRELFGTEMPFIVHGLSYAVELFKKHASF